MTRDERMERLTLALEKALDLFPDGVYKGLTRRDWFATFAPEPSQGLIAKEIEHDRTRREKVFRSIDEIIVDLKYEYADRMIAASKRNNNVE